MDRAGRIEQAKRFLPWLTMFAGWLLLFGKGYVKYLVLSLDPSVLADDTRIQLPNFYRFADGGLFRDDAVGRYHSDGTPDLFRAIYFVAVQLGELVLFSKLLAHFLWLITLAGIFVAVLRLAGKPAAFIAVCLCLSTDIVLDRIAGALPRGFGYPILAWVAAALVCGWPRVMAALVVVGAGFYPPLAPIGGACLALLLLIVPQGDRGAAREWSLRRRVAWLAMTGMAVAVMSAPLMLRMKGYGELIRPSRTAEFPEIGPGGRVGKSNRAVPPPFFEEAAGLAGRTVFAVGRDLVPALKAPLRRGVGLQKIALTALVLASVAGFALFAARATNAGARRLCALAAVSLFGYVVGTVVNPALGPPQRFAQFPIPIVIVVALPVVALGFCPRRWFTAEGKPGPKAGVVTVAAGLVLLGFFGSRDPADSGLEVRVYAAERKVARAIAKLPKRAVIAGWPSDTLDHVPLLTKRATLISHQMYQPYHTRMTKKMRERMRAVLNVYYQPESPDLDALRRLRDDFRVTHFLLEKRLFRKPPPHPLFEPFRKDLRRRLVSWNALPRSQRGPHGRRRLRRATVYEDRNFALIELKKLR
jgi:hypothetical protein